jgi:hypothetical protein
MSRVDAPMSRRLLSDERLRHARRFLWSRPSGSLRDDHAHLASDRVASKGRHIDIEPAVVEIAQRLVEQENLWREHERACDRDPAAAGRRTEPAPAAALRC